MGNTSNNKWIKTWSIVQDEQAGAHHLLSGGDDGEVSRRRLNSRAQPVGNVPCQLVLPSRALSIPRIGLVKNIADVYK